MPLTASVFIATSLDGYISRPDGAIDWLETANATIPVLLGSGRRLFGALDADVPLELVASRAYPFGFLQSTYRVRR